MRLLVYGLAALAVTITCPLSAAQEKVARITEYPVPVGSHPHDVAPAPDGGSTRGAARWRCRPPQGAGVLAGSPPLRMEPCTMLHLREAASRASTRSPAPRR